MFKIKNYKSLKLKNKTKYILTIKYIDYKPLFISFYLYYKVLGI